MARAVFSIAACALLLEACAFGGGAANAASAWIAYGYFGPATPGRAPEVGDVIGEYQTREACERAANDWRVRQVVGAPVFAECLPSPE